MAWFSIMVVDFPWDWYIIMSYNSDSQIFTEGLQSNVAQVQGSLLFFLFQKHITPAKKKIARPTPMAQPGTA